jgi:hypothetical protein
LALFCVTTGCTSSATTFDGTAEQLPTCGGRESIHQGICGETTALWRNIGTHGIVCYYAAGTDALVGAVKSDDVDSQCGGRNARESGGQFPGIAECAPSSFPVVRSCP